MTAERSRLLVVDDDAAHRALVKAWLRDRYIVEEAARGEAAIEKASAAAPSIALVDLALPDLHGHEVAARLRATCGDTLHLVAVSGLVDRDRRRAALAAGFDDVIEKSELTPEVLIRRLRRDDSPVAPEGGDLERERAALERRFEAGLAARIEAIRAALESPSGTSGEAHRLAHNLSGSAAAYGFPALAQAARDLARAMDPATLPAPEGVEIHRLLEALAREIELLTR